MQLTDYELKAIIKLRTTIMQGKWSNEGLLSLLKLILSDDGLNVKTVANAAKELGKSTQYLRTTDKCFKVDNTQFIYLN